MMTSAQPATATKACELDRHAFNACFHDLGLVWYWDIDTYESLCADAADASARVRRYLVTAQAHLLKAYDADFLVGTIVERMSRIRNSPTGCTPWATAFERPVSCRGVIGF